MDKIKSLTGMLDLYDDGDNSLLPAKLFYLEEKIKHIFKSYKLNEIRTPVLEDTNLFIRSVGRALYCSTDLQHQPCLDSPSFEPVLCLTAPLSEG